LFILHYYVYSSEIAQTAALCRALFSCAARSPLADVSGVELVDESL